jgi:hypothetical protein
LPEGAPALSGHKKSKTPPTYVQFHGFCGILLVGISIAINNWHIIDNATDYRQTAMTYSNAASIFELLKLAWSWKIYLHISLLVGSNLYACYV